MDALESYLADCENKRRRMRDRPNDAVLTQLRFLLDYFKTDRTTERPPTESDSNEAPTPDPSASH
jgi:hypothetical protein